MMLAMGSGSRDMTTRLPTGLYLRRASRTLSRLRRHWMIVFVAIPLLGARTSLGAQMTVWRSRASLPVPTAVESGLSGDRNLGFSCNTCMRATSHFQSSATAHTATSASGSASGHSRQFHVWVGVLTGVAVGTGTGLIVGHNQRKPCPQCDVERAFQALDYPVGLGVLGAVVGGVVGALWPVSHSDVPK
jgi:hypothetical protein